MVLPLVRSRQNHTEMKRIQRFKSCHTIRRPIAFAAERDLLADLLAPWLAGEIEHVGSTAVPGLAAKPVIDIMAPVHTLVASKDAIAALQQLCYVYFPHRPTLMHWFCKPSPEFRTHHLHLVPFNGELWRDRLAFRDRLRDDPRLAAEYAALKMSLATAHPTDREAYTEGKAPFVRRVLQQQS